MILGQEHRPAIFPRKRQKARWRGNPDWYCASYAGLDLLAQAIAIWCSQVSLGSFARLFPRCAALSQRSFLRRAVSALSNGERMMAGGNYPAGPIIAVSAKR
ncbi:hypothetical protein BQ8482_340100 [Mesorhizobium delmotii]|uniref:Transposase n=1 Tax=Mesorhizobium delmotii TaxID=1631247 RepID=A0A2P9APW1_9HYPH|nr:hypothetical protein BQ8482_340100 [Mesorhizobium delmotii]